MSGAAHGRAVVRSGVMVTVETVAKISSAWRSWMSTSCSVGSTRSTSAPPSVSVLHATRRQTPSAASSAPWPLTSPITRWTRAVARLHEVVEVAAQQGALAARAVAGADEQRAVVEDRHRQQPALQARGLLGQDLGRAQPLADAVGLAALDGVEDGPAQAVAVDAALHQVVLSAGGDRVDAALVVAVAGEHEMRDVRAPRRAGARARRARWRRAGRGRAGRSRRARGSGGRAPR